jgi:hypothetical protein
MYVHVPAFHALKCHGKGVRTKKKLRKENRGKRGYVGSAIVREYASVKSSDYEKESSREGYDDDDDEMAAQLNEKGSRAVPQSNKPVSYSPFPLHYAEYH